MDTVEKSPDCGGYLPRWILDELDRYVPENDGENETKIALISIYHLVNSKKFSAALPLLKQCNPPPSQNHVLKSLVHLFIAMCYYEDKRYFEACEHITDVVYYQTNFPTMVAHTFWWTRNDALLEEFLESDIFDNDYLFVGAEGSDSLISLAEAESFLDFLERSRTTPDAKIEIILIDEKDQIVKHAEGFRRFMKKVSERYTIRCPYFRNMFYHDDVTEPSKIIFDLCYPFERREMLLHLSGMIWKHSRILFGETLSDQERMMAFCRIFQSEKHPEWPSSLGFREESDVELFKECGKVFQKN